VTATEHAHETALLQQAQAGDYDAFDDLHTTLEPAISRFVRRLIGHQQEAEDIVQDTFLSLYMNLDKLDPTQPPRPYVYRIARNRCYDILRRQGRYDQVSLDHEPTQVRVSFDLSERYNDAPEEVAHWMLLHLEVQEAIERLPETQRQALILYSEEELSYAEIAEVMEISLGTVKSRLYHAKKTLRGLLSLETLAAINEDLLDDEPKMTSPQTETKIEPEDDEARINDIEAMVGEI